MKLKFSLNGLHTLKTFYSLFSMLSKQGEELCLVFTKETFGIFLDVKTPLVWIEIKMSSLASTYVLEAQDNGDIIIIEVSAKHILLSLDMFQKEATTAEIRLTKEGDFPCLKITGTINVGLDQTASFKTEIPVIIAPNSKMDQLMVPTDEEYDTIVIFTRFTTLRKYVDIYKTFKYVFFNIRHTTLQLTANQIGSKVSTTFEDLSFYKEGKANPQSRIEACVDAKKVASYLTSTLSLYDIPIDELLIGITHKRMMKISFDNKDENINFNFVIPTHVNDDDDVQSEIDEDEEGN